MSSLSMLTFIIENEPVLSHNPPTPNCHCYSKFGVETLQEVWLLSTIQHAKARVARNWDSPQERLELNLLLGLQQQCYGLDSRIVQDRYHDTAACHRN